MDNNGVRYFWGPLRALLHKMPERSRIPILSVVTGILCGLAAVLLKVTIRAIHHGLDSLVGDANWLFLLLPGVGMLLSLLIVRYIVRDNIGHGVTKVLQAVSKNESKIKRHNLFSSLVTSALTIGFGGSVGAEAPIVYTGAAIGSNLGRYMGMSYRGMTLLLGCGAAGAVAGIFNAPLAGVLFTLEILLFNLSMSGILPLLLSSVSATLVSYLCLGKESPFAASIVDFNIGNVPFYLLLGILCGLFSLYFIHTTLGMEDKLSRIKNPFLKWLVSSVALGLLIFLFPPLHGEGYNFLTPLLGGLDPEIGIGTPVGRLLNFKWGVPVFFLMVVLLKVFSMTFTNAGGGVGGTFGPTLFVGALVGFVAAYSMNLIVPGALPVSNFVLVGMAGLMAGVMQAPLTAIFLIAEISGGYQLLVPLILTSAVAYGTTRIFEKYSIYTKRIAASGELLTHEADKAVLTLLKTEDLLETDFLPVRMDDTLGRLVEAVSSSNRSIFPVVDARGRFQGYVTLGDIRKDMFRPELYEKRHVFNYLKTAPEYVHTEDSMEDVMRKFEKTGAWNLPVVEGESRQYLGFLSKSKIFNAYRESLKDFSQD
ncbi:MAG: chloride channel protein [Bacteroidales bacterium]|nr:chloride channel protein [Bacteroidales bacterium]